MRKDIQIKPKDWVRMMFCIKHLMKLHPEYNEMIMPFYSKMYEIYPYNEENPFHFEEDYVKDDGESIDMSLDEMIWSLGLNLPSWEDGEQNEEESPS